MNRLFRARGHDDRGSGTVVVLGMGVGLAALATLLIPLYMGLATRQAVAAAADAAALAGADVASGLIPGFPCETAARVAAGNGAGLASCVVDGLIVTVTASRSIVGVAVTSTATAGPPGSGVD